MQLKSPRSLKQALAVAGATLLGSHGAKAEPSSDTIDSGVLFYQESGRVRAIEPSATLNLDLGDKHFFSIGLIADALTGATPIGAVPSSRSQDFVRPLKLPGTAETVTTASGGSKVIIIPPPPGSDVSSVGALTTIAANRMPLDYGFKDERVGGHLSWSQPLTEQLQLSLGAAYSHEHDYRSMSANAGLAQDFNERNTTLNFGLNYESDRSFPLGGTPDALTIMSAAWKGPERSKNELDALLGVTQVMNRRWLTQLGLSYGSARGYQSDPYKMISVVDAVTGEPLNQLYEGRPDARRKLSLFWDNKFHLRRDVIGFSARYYHDDWGVSSQTYEARYRLQWASSWYLEPHVRWYVQHAADFYRYYLVQGNGLPEFASSDTRLGAFDARTLGLKLGIVTQENRELAVRAEYYLQHGDGHPAGAIGQLAQQDLFPDLKAFMVLLNYTIHF